ncbi:hypothetical protein AA14337_2722 [Acetobacter malorum DSM 14337]|uniref:Uncharacterized protein n=1 Tax=Acetobacter malorum DSM 14337 TaxID=1307910 RepID=A0ABQ0PXB3_9PROT|nr:hypothetical protein [Acetobacter malorum]GBQ83952.1 hypothetical protein AA14337_2722 [Acetobacter malorum DSM 14337]
MQHRDGPRLSFALIAATAAIGLVILWLARLGLPVSLKLINCFMLGMLVFCYGLSWLYWRQEQTRG